MKTFKVEVMDGETVEARHVAEAEMPWEAAEKATGKQVLGRRDEPFRVRVIDERRRAVLKYAFKSPVDDGECRHGKHQNDRECRAALKPIRATIEEGPPGVLPSEREDQVNGLQSPAPLGEAKDLSRTIIAVDKADIAVQRRFEH